jgi:hypothetical protein
MKTLVAELKTETDVNVMINTILDQVMNQQNYDMVVDCVIHFEECEPQDIGYVIGTLQFNPWGADAFEVMESCIRKVVSPDFMSIAITVNNVQISFEDEVRALFNSTFTKLDENKSAGSMYVGDNSCFILQYLDTTEDEQNMIWEDLKTVLAAKHCMQKNPNGSTLLVEIY